MPLHCSHPLTLFSHLINAKKNPILFKVLLCEMYTDYICRIDISMVLVSLLANNLFFCMNHVRKVQLELGRQLFRLIVVKILFGKILDTHWEIRHLDIFGINEVLFSWEGSTEPHCVDDPDYTDDSITNYDDIRQSMPLNRPIIVQLHCIDVALVLKE